MVLALQEFSASVDHHLKARLGGGSGSSIVVGEHVLDS